MTHHGFSTDNDLLALRADSFAGLSERADRIVADLTGTLSGFGECWGSDAAGEAFAASHVEPAGAALTDIGVLPTGFSDIAERLVATAATYADTELAAGDTVRRAGRDLD